MERGDRRHTQRPEEIDDVVAVVAAPDAVFMLDRDDVDTLVDGSRDMSVVGLLIATDPVVHLEGIRRGLAGGVERHDLTAAAGRRKVLRERCDPALPGRIGGNECSPYDDGPPLGRAHR